MIIYLKGLVEYVRGINTRIRLTIIRTVDAVASLKSIIDKRSFTCRWITCYLSLKRPSRSRYQLHRQLKWLSYALKITWEYKFWNVFLNSQSLIKWHTFALIHSRPSCFHDFSRELDLLWTNSIALNSIFSNTIKICF